MYYINNTVMCETTSRSLLMDEMLVGVIPKRVVGGGYVFMFLIGGTVTL